MKKFENLMKLSYDFNQDNFDKNWAWQLLNSLFNANFIEDKDRDYSTMPKKIHQIWLGGTIPEEYRILGETCKKINPDWEYKLWGDGDVKEFDIPMSVFNSLTNYGQKSDILRYFILKKYGGLYLDTDFECLKPLDDLTHLNFMVTVGYPTKVEFYNGMIACTPNHPIISHVVDSLDFDTIRSKGFLDIFDTTGGYFFTKCILELISDNKKGFVAFPPAYFFPFPNEPDFHLRNGKDYIQKDSYALHYWECSWIENVKEKRYGK